MLQQICDIQGLAIDNPVLGNKETGNPALAYAAKGNATLSFAIICFKPL
jgi:hypothetical protein